MTARVDRIIDRAVRILEGLAALTAAAGVSLAAMEYISSQRSERAARTIELVDRWEDSPGGALHAYQRLAAQLRIAFQERDTTRFAEMTPEAGAAELVETALASEGVRKDFDTVVYFFSRLELCIDSRICDDRAAKTFFEDTLESFLANFTGEIRLQQKLDPRFGESLFDLSDTFGALD